MHVRSSYRKCIFSIIFPLSYQLYILYLYTSSVHRHYRLCDRWMNKSQCHIQTIQLINSKKVLFLKIPQAIGKSELKVVFDKKKLSNTQTVLFMIIMQITSNTFFFILLNFIFCNLITQKICRCNNTCFLNDVLIALCDKILNYSLRTKFSEFIRRFNL